MTAAPLLSIEGIDVAYGQTQVLFGVDLEVAEGEMVALLGTNGAGKSTVLRAVAGLTPPSRGTVRFAGQDITKLDAAATSRLGITQVPGGRGVFPSLTVAENLRVAGWSRRKERADLQQRQEQCLEWFPALERRWHTAAGDLSGGEQQMLSLSQALLGRPRLLMIDELSLGLAPAVVEDLLQIVRAIHADGAAVVLVEQSVSTALRLADRAVFMEKGEVRFEGPTAELLERDDILRAVYLRGTAGAATTKSKRKRRTLSAGSSDTPALEAIGLTKHYGGVRAVDEVDLRLAEGELLGVIGPNGAGKTTVFDLLTGFTVPDSGRVLLRGEDVTRAPAHRRAGLGLGRTFQDARLWPSLTVRECLVVVCERNLTSRDPLSAILRLPSQRESEAVAGATADDLVELVGVQAYAGKFLSELSTGSRRMVEIACLLANGASVLLLDEPSSGIAQRETEALGPVLLDLRVQLGASIVLIEHDMQLLTSVADRLLALDTGSVVTEGDADAVLSHPQVVASYLGERRLVHRMSGKPVLVAVAAVAVVALVIVAIGQAGSDDGGTGGSSAKGLPSIEGSTPPTDYRLVYKVTSPDSIGTEEHIVHRPFDARIIVRDADDNVTSERWSVLGQLVTRSQGAEAVRIDTAIAPAASDARPERFDAQLAKAGKVNLDKTATSVGGRACTFASEAGSVATSSGDPAAGGATEQLPVVVARCVDAQGLVLEERWTTAGGERVLTKRAQELELGDDVPDIDLPDATPLSASQGNGAVRKVDRAQVPPFAEVFEMPDPKGFTYVGRYAVAPARLSGSADAIPSDADLALYTDVWRRGPDLVFLDQGATRGGATPFNPDTRIGDVELADLGTAELAVDVRSAEIRLSRPDSGFVRLVGTVPVGDLITLAATIKVLEVTR